MDDSNEIFFVTLENINLLLTESQQCENQSLCQIKIMTKCQFNYIIRQTNTNSHNKIANDYYFIMRIQG